jgi:ribosomal-protein-alanine N-acetyltransferase
MKIRPASSDDLSMILAIENLTNQIPWTKEQFISSVEVGHYSVVLESQEGVLGFAIYSPIVPESHLLNIAIAPKHQGHGLGRKLLQKVIMQNKILGVKSITLEVRVSNNSAISLYESEGFAKDAIRPNYYSGDPKEDAVLMSLWID